MGGGVRERGREGEREGLADCLNRLNFYPLPGQSFYKARFNDHLQQNHLGSFLKMQIPGPQPTEMHCQEWGLGFSVLTGSQKSRTALGQVAHRGHPADGGWRGLPFAEKSLFNAYAKTYPGHLQL